MRRTPFPTTPSDVVSLTVSEFACELDLKESSIDAVCRRFFDDTDRALVWFIRFRALRAWCERSDMATWLRSQASHAHHACEVAASFELNDDWEFDAERFRSAVESVARELREPERAWKPRLANATAFIRGRVARFGL